MSAADILAFWALLPDPSSVDGPPSGQGEREANGSGDRWQLAVAILDADEADPRVKGIREKLYPGMFRPG